jgi:hypothetical protein
MCLRTVMQPERLLDSSRGQGPPRRDAAHGISDTHSIRPCRGRISLPSHTPQRIDDPFRVGSVGGDAIRGRRPGVPGLAPGYYRAGLQPAGVEPPSCLRSQSGISACHRSAGLQPAITFLAVSLPLHCGLSAYTAPADSETDQPQGVIPFWVARQRLRGHVVVPEP